MQSTRFILAALLLLAFALPASAIDQISRKDGERLAGTIKTVTSQEVVITKTGGGDETVPVNQIESIVYTDEPAKMRLLRGQIRGANWNSAVEMLADATLDPAAQTIKAVEQDLVFYKALANARLAQSGTGDAVKARDELEKFIADGAGSWHYFEAVEVLGDLYASSSEPDKAVPHYQKLSDAPWTDYKMRAFVSIGKAHMAAGNAEEATKQFDQALQLGQGMEADALIASQLLAARLGKAAAMAKTGKAAEGITMVKEVISKAPAEEKELHAAAYVTLGNCYLASGDTPENNKAALLAYLHVDVLYYAYGEYHAEALYNLSKLWQTLKRPDRATEADQVLKSRYKNSAWARKA